MTERRRAATATRVLVAGLSCSATLGVAAKMAADERAEPPPPAPAPAVVVIVRKASPAPAPLAPAPIPVTRSDGS